MVRVKKCPRNLTAVLAASSRLECGTDVYGNSQYMCLPNVQKSSLVEFCYGDVMGMQEKGVYHLKYKIQLSISIRLFQKYLSLREGLQNCAVMVIIVHLPRQVTLIFAVSLVVSVI